VVQRIPVRIAIEETGERPPLRAGMTVTVVVDTGRERSAFDLVRGLFAPARASSGK
jgi:membrane fusion protein (multidrug efflux system)